MPGRRLNTGVRRYDDVVGIFSYYDTVSMEAVPRPASQRVSNKRHSLIDFSMYYARRTFIIRLNFSRNFYNGYVSDIMPEVLQALDDVLKIGFMGEYAG